MAVQQPDDTVEQARGRLGPGGDQLEQDHHRGLVIETALGDAACHLDQRGRSARFAPGAGVIRPARSASGAGAGVCVAHRRRQISRQLTDRRGCRRQLVRRDDAVDQDVRGDRPPGQRGTVGHRQSDHRGGDLHRNPLRDSAHPVDPATTEIVGPCLREASTNGRFELADACRRHRPHGELPMIAVPGPVGGGQDVHRVAQAGDRELRDRAVAVPHHRGGQVRREVLGASDRVGDQVPGADGEER